MSTSPSTDDDVLPPVESKTALRRHVSSGSVAGDAGAATKVKASIRCVATLQAPTEAMRGVESNALRERLCSHVYSIPEGDRVQVRVCNVLLLMHAGVTNRLSDGQVSLLIAALVEELAETAAAMEGDDGE
jgi:hypothetical protein